MIIAPLLWNPGYTRDVCHLNLSDWCIITDIATWHHNHYFKLYNIIVRINGIKALFTIQMLHYLWIFFLGNEQLIAPESHECACSGTILTFNCTTVGFGTTLWKGTAFKCPNKGNQILLLNSLFSSGDTGSSGRCGDNIVARGVKVDDNCHTSQLNITVLSEVLNQTSVECMYSSNQGSKTVGRVVITVILSKESRVLYI